MRKIILVDDDNNYVSFIGKFLNRRGYSVDIAGSIKEAKTLLDKETPLVVGCDFELTDGTGMELLNWFRQENKKTPFLLISNKEKRFYEKEARAHGVTICIDKLQHNLVKDKLLEYAYLELSENESPSFHKILFVHANNIEARVLTAAMLQRGFYLVLVETITEAKERLAEDPHIELILCDVSLEDGNARDLIHFVRRVTEQLKNVKPFILKMLPFFIITENNDLSVEYCYRHEGVNDYLLMPINIPELVRRMVYFIE